MTTDDIPVAMKRAIVEQEIALWKNTSYQASVRMRVQKKLGDTEQMAAITKDMERCEMALDALAEELAALPADGAI